MKKVLFLNLTAFSQTGGLEKFNKCFLKALQAIESDTNIVSESYSMYDTAGDEKYYHTSAYKGFGKNKLGFVLSAFFKGLKSDIVILGHINLALVGFLIRLFAPSKKIMLVCHGIEVWESLPFLKRTILRSANRILAVSSFTKNEIIRLHQIAADKITVFHNTIDPYFPVPATFNKDFRLQQRYGITESDFVLFTLCRLSSNEQYKGYDYVITALPQLLSKYPNIKYLVAGKYDEQEMERMRKLLSELGVTDSVIFAGYVQDEELIAHYQLGDVYIMPSQREGFGIVFIEAMVCGVSVIAGNKDGSVDALANGALGKLVDPINVDEIAKAIESYYLSTTTEKSNDPLDLQKRVVQNFGFNLYTNRLKQIMQTV